MPYEHIPGKEIAALGFGFGAACSMLEQNTDPRQFELPSLLEEWSNKREEHQEMPTPMNSAPKDKPVIGYLPESGVCKFAVVYYDAYYAEGGDGFHEGQSGWVIEFAGEVVEDYGGLFGWTSLPDFI